MNFSIAVLVIDQCASCLSMVLPSKQLSIPLELKSKVGKSDRCQHIVFPLDSSSLLPIDGNTNLVQKFLDKEHQCAIKIDIRHIIDKEHTIVQQGCAIVIRFIVSSLRGVATSDRSTLSLVNAYVQSTVIYPVKILMLYTDILLLITIKRKDFSYFEK